MKRDLTLTFQLLTREHSENKSIVAAVAVYVEIMRSTESEPIMLFMINNNMNDTSNAHIMTEKPLSGFNFNISM
jgi:hypothetical protein